MRKPQPEESGADRRNSTRVRTIWRCDALPKRQGSDRLESEPLDAVTSGGCRTGGRGRFGGSSVRRRTSADEVTLLMSCSNPTARNIVPYSTAVLRQDLLRVRNAWEECQTSRERDAIY